MMCWPVMTLRIEQPGGEAGAGEHAERADGAEEVQRSRHVAEQETDGEQIEEDAEGAGDAVVALAVLRARGWRWESRRCWRRTRRRVRG